MLLITMQFSHRQFIRLTEIGYVLMNARIKRCLVPDSSQPVEGSKVIHTSNCKDSLAFFKFLETGAIQHAQSGLCIHLSGNRWSLRNREKAILKRGESFTHKIILFFEQNYFPVKRL